MTATTAKRSLLIGAATALLLIMACREDVPEVVVYTSVDQVFSQPVLERFQEEFLHRLSFSTLRLPAVCGTYLA